MISLILILNLTTFVLGQIVRKTLHSSPSIFNDCVNSARQGQNTLLGDKFFYDFLTDSGTYTNLDIFTFTIWVYLDGTNNPNINGKHVLFQLVAGMTDNPHVNLAVSMHQKNGLFLNLDNGPVGSSPVFQFRIPGRGAMQDLGYQWIFVTVSIDQSTAHTYVNTKIFSSNLFMTFVDQRAFLDRRLFSFFVDPQLRITNERLLNQLTDIRACGYLAQFDYYIGLSDMSVDLYVDYDSHLIFYLKPFQNSLANLAPYPTELKSTSSVTYTGSIGLQLFKNTQIQYLFEEDIQSFTIAFWFKSNAQTPHQLVSFVTDDMKETCIGLKLRQNGWIYLMSGWSEFAIGNFWGNQWYRLVLACIHLGRDKKFNPLFDNMKRCKAYLNGVESAQHLAFVYPKRPGRLIIGELFKDKKSSSDFVEIQEIKIFRGAGVRFSNNPECSMMIGMNRPYCLNCVGNNHYCNEFQTPTNDNLYYICPAGQRLVGGVCIDNTTPRCLRQNDDGTCARCDLGLSWNGSSCVGTLTVLPKQRCVLGSNANTEICNFSSYANGQLYLDPIVCEPGVGFDARWNMCTGWMRIFNCRQEFEKGCLRCNNLSYVQVVNRSGRQECRVNCLPSSKDMANVSKRFLDTASGQCVSTCPKFYSYQYDTRIGLYHGRCYDSCTLSANSICIQEGQYIESFEGGPLTTTLIYDQWRNTYSERVRACSSECQKCYHTSPSTCLECPPTQFFDRFTTTCYDQCLESNYFFLSNEVNRLCERTCPSGTFQYTSFCVASCPLGFYPYKNQCYDTQPISTYLGPDNQYHDCPQYCLECTDSSNCTRCVNNQPINNNLCVITCIPRWRDVETNRCTDSCLPTDFFYEADNFNGFKFKECFKNQCSTITANDVIYTVSNHLNPQVCQTQCDVGYYADYGELKCMACTSNCRTCENKSSYCLTCLTDFFFFENGCFSDCKRRFKNHMRFTCDGSCPAGYVIEEGSIKACVASCGMAPYELQKFQYKQNCYSVLPSISIYCEPNNECFDCDSVCATCRGPLNTDCLICKQGYLHNFSCVTNCPAPLFHDTTTGTCVVSCPTGSKRHNNFCYSNCKAVPSSPYQYGDQCLTSQPPKTYLVQKNGFYKCKNCHAACQACTQPFSTTCSACVSGYFLFETSCLVSCPAGYFKNSSNNRCVTSCPSLREGDSCVSSCVQGIFIFMNQCIINGECPSGYYLNSQNTCASCAGQCSKCTGPQMQDCTSCLTNSYFYNGSCYSNCPQQAQYHDETNWACRTICPDGSYVDERQPNVFYCQVGCPSYYYWKVCMDSCPLQTYADSQKQCRPCAAECYACYGPLVSQCSACDEGLFLDQTTCVTKCPAQRPFGDADTAKCLSTCSIFTYLEQEFCFTTCPSYLLTYQLNGKKECLRDCYIGSFIQGSQCVACASECLTCFGTEVFQCITCNSGYYLQSTTCTTTCAELYNEVQQICVNKCPPNLYQLNGAKNQCLLACPLGKVSYQQVCIDVCPSFTALNNGLCYDCHSYCTECTGTSVNECKKCTPGFYLQGTTCLASCLSGAWIDVTTQSCISQCPPTLFQILESKTCVVSCPATFLVHDFDNKHCLKSCYQGYYEDSGQCLQCNPACEICRDQTTCSACSEGFFLEIDKCLTKCQNAILFMDKVNRVCTSKCPPNQFSYESYGKLFCVLACPLGTKLLDKFCVAACPLGMFEDSNQLCKSCPQECTACTSFTTCTACHSGYYLTNTGNCDTNCGSQILNKILNLCVDSCQVGEFEYNGFCQSNCPTSPLYLKYHTACVTECPSNSYRDYQNCLDCATQCLTCNGPTNSDCMICKAGYFMFGQVCDTACPLGYLKDTVQMTCTLSCKHDLYLDNDSCVSVCPTFTYKKLCVSSCPLQTFIHNYTICVDCDPSCKTCNAAECLECNPSYYLYQGLCQSTCPSLYDDQNLKCVEQCPNALTAYFDRCTTSCPLIPLPYYNFNGVCVKDCPRFTALQLNKCVSCDERCQECTSLENCIKCKSNFFLFNGRCVLQCPIAKPFQDRINWLCVTDCPAGTYLSGTLCVTSCPGAFYNRICVDKCPEGFYGLQCEACRSECKTCSSFSHCLSCNPNYYLLGANCETSCPNIKDQTTWKCTDKCRGLLYQNTCYATCPPGTHQFYEICMVDCKEGYYPSSGKCLPCPSECKSCTSPNQCQQCNLGTYLQNERCLDKCKDGLFGNAKVRKCGTSCPKSTYAHDGLCQFSCPKGYLYSNQSCVQQCSQTQFLAQITCYSCAVECQGCKGGTNRDCDQCAVGFQAIEDRCSGPCPAGYTMVEERCQPCRFQCLTCKDSVSACTKCKGDRITESCLCPEGYFDDEFSENCQKCPCLACTSEANCTTCKNNLKTPNCSCDKYAAEDWCITCEVGRTTIRFADDLNSIVVDFSYLISVNMLNPFQPSSCSLWFENFEILGQDSSCYQSWDRMQIVINLGRQAKILIGDRLVFKQKLYKDVNEKPCDEYLSFFVDTIVLPPFRQLKPYVRFYVPEKVTSCMEFNITQESVWGTGSRNIRVLQWRLGELSDESHYYEIDYFLSQQGMYIAFPMNVLKPNTSYTITAKYINFLEKVNQTSFTFRTIPTGKPLVYFTLSPLYVKAFIFDCIQTYADLPTPFEVSYFIYNDKNETILRGSYSVSKQYYLALNESLLPKNKPLRIKAFIEDQDQELSFVLPPTDFDVKFLQKSRFLGQLGKINPRAYDLDEPISPEVSSYAFNYSWRCTNLYNLEPCKTRQNQIVKFPEQRVIRLEVDSSNTTFVFHVKVEKNSRWLVKEHLIVFTDLSIETEFVPNTNAPSGYINPNDDVYILLKNIQTYAMIIYDYKLIGTQMISGDSLRFKLINYQQTFQGSNEVTIYLLPGTDSMKFTLNYNSLQGNVTVDPPEGDSLDEFQVTVQVSGDIDLPLLYNYYYYDTKVRLDEDMTSYKVNHGIPLEIKTTEPKIKTRLPNGIDDDEIFILVRIQDSKGAIKFLKTSVQVHRKDYSFSQLVTTALTMNSELEDKSVATSGAVIEAMRTEARQVCLKQCSGVGQCVNQKCQCPPGYYFDDCSGTQEDYKKYQNLLVAKLESLILENFDDNESFRLVVKSLNFLATQDSIVWESFDEKKSLSFLIGVNSNMERRLTMINQFGINIVHQQTSDFKYDKLDITAIVNSVDLVASMKCTDLIWNNLLRSKQTDAKYDVSYQLRKAVENVVELSFMIMSLEEKIDYSGSGATVIVQRTSNFSTQIAARGHRLLESKNEAETKADTTPQPVANQSQQNNQSSSPQSVSNQSQWNNQSSSNATQGVKQYYDVVQQIFVRNLYAYDGYFKYPDQQFPLYDYQIRIMNRMNNIHLQYPINYTFAISEKGNYVCITRNAVTFEWSPDSCITVRQQHRISCNCTVLAPTTLVDDNEFIYAGSQSLRLKIPNMMLYIFCLQALVIILIGWKGASLDSQKSEPEQGKEGGHQKYGHINKLYIPKGVNIWQNSQVKKKDSQEEFERLPESEGISMNQSSSGSPQSGNKKKSEKYSLENFKYHHFLLSIIYKRKKYQPRWFRAFIILMRWMVVTSLAGFYSSYIYFEIGAYAVLGSFMVCRLIESHLRGLYQKFNFQDQSAMRVSIQLFVGLVIVTSALAFFYFWFSFLNETEWIISYMIGFSIDALLLDFLILLFSKFLGESSKRSLQKKAKELKNLHQVKVAQSKQLL